MKVAVIMKRAHTCSPIATLHEAAGLMDAHRCGWLPVVAAGQLVGVLTDRDITLAAYRSRKPLWDLQVAQAMTPDVRTCGPEDDIEVAETRMRSEHVRRLPVVDEQRRVRGFVSLSDLARGALEIGAADHGLTRADVAETLAAVVDPK